jgi:hypothetical protein
MIGSKEKAATDSYDLRGIAIDARDGIIDEWEHHDAQADALKRFGEGHDPKILARLAVLAHDQRPCRTCRA